MADLRGTILELIATPSFIPVPNLAHLPKSARIHFCSVTYMLDYIGCEKIESLVEFIPC